MFEDLWELISDNAWFIIEDYGWFAGVFVFATVLLARMIYHNYNKWTGKPIEQVEDTDSLDSNVFFSNAEYTIKVEIPSLELIEGKPIREKVFKDLLKISFSVIYQIATEMINNHELSTWSSSEWVDHMTRYVNSMIIQTEMAAKDQEIPNLVVRKFFEWHTKSIESLKDYVLILGNSKVYATNNEKLNILLLLMHLLLVTILGDAERIVESINGEITGLEYKGQRIEG